MDYNEVVFLTSHIFGGPSMKTSPKDKNFPVTRCLGLTLEKFAVSPSYILLLLSVWLAIAFMIVCEEGITEPLPAILLQF